MPLVKFLKRFFDLLLRRKMTHAHQKIQVPNKIDQTDSKVNICSVGIGLKWETLILAVIWKVFVFARVSREHCCIIVMYILQENTLLPMYTVITCRIYSKRVFDPRNRGNLLLRLLIKGLFPVISMVGYLYSGVKSSIHGE